MCGELVAGTSQQESQRTVAELIGVSKAFGGVHALASVDFEIREGEVHALCGENGAGKSTLIKILSGILPPDEGQVIIAGSSGPTSSDDRTNNRVAVIHQESVACLDLDAVDNLFLGRELSRWGGMWLDRRAMSRAARQSMELLGEDIDIKRPLRNLSVAKRQMVGIARALSQQCRLLIMDEPTASLSDRETEVLFRIVRQLRDDGVSILYVSHRMEEIFSLADRVTVLRDGRRIATEAIRDVDATSLIRMMVGRDLDLSVAERPDKTIGAARLGVSGLTSEGVFSDVSFTVHAHEIVGLFGMVGAGRSEIASAIFGIAPYDSGSVALDGQPLPPASIQQSIDRGLAFVPEDRQHLGLVLPLSVSENLSLAKLRSLTRLGLIHRRAEHELVADLIHRLQVRTASPRIAAGALSGGNQQKLVLGKWLARNPRVLILDEPTRGVDVGAKAAIHDLVRDLADEGLATLVISSDLPEVLALCDRVIVIREGEVAGILEGSDATQEAAVSLALPQGKEPRARPVLKTAGRALPGFVHQREFWILVLTLATVAIVGMMEPSFLAVGNLVDLIHDAAPLAIMAAAMTYVILTGEIDISVGSVLGLSAAAMGLLSYGDQPLTSPLVGAALAVALATGLGALNGLLVTIGRVPSIVATLGMLMMLRGVTTFAMGGTNIYGRPLILQELATGDWLGVPYSVLIAGAVVAIASLVATRWAFGRRVYAVGSNSKAAQLFGVSPTRTRFLVFVLSGFAAGVAAILIAPKNSLIQGNLGEGLELTVITCVVVGGTSIQGGRGHVLGSVIAVLLVSMVPMVLTYVGAPSQWRMAIQGAFILAAVLADRLTQDQAPLARTA